MPDDVERPEPASNGAVVRKRRETETLTINKHFAERYQTAKRKQLLSSVPAAALEDSSPSESSEEEEEDDFAEQLTKGIDRRVRETLEAIRKKDPRIYDKQARFFDDDGGEDESGEEEHEGGDRPDGENEEYDSDMEPVAGWDNIAESAKAEIAKMTLKDYVRETLLKDGKLSDSEEDDEQEGEWGSREGHVAQTSEIAPAEGDVPNRRSALVSESDSDDDLDSDDFFQKKEKSAAELEEEEKDFDKFLRKQSRKTSQKAGEELLLHSYLENEKPDEKERFLRDFVLNNGWLDKNAKDAPAARDYEIEIDNNNPDKSGDEKNSSDDDFEEIADDFEAQYNFRFEDPDGTKVVSHARTVPDSMRRPDDRRKRAREARKLRKQREKLAKTEEIKHLKNLKKKEVKARLLAIQEAAGDGIDVSGIDLDADFDPDEFNRQMESKFGDDYYAQKDEEMKQVTKEGLATATEKRLSAKESEEVSKDLREDVNKLMDEYYNLDYEDIVAGVPMRFNYKKVEPESFNMSAHDILGMEDKELNRIVSMKYLAPYRANRDIKKQSWRVHDALKKHRKSKQIHGEKDGSQSDLQALAKSRRDLGPDGDDTSFQKHDKKRKRMRKQSQENGGAGENGGRERRIVSVVRTADENGDSSLQGDGDNTKSSKKRKRRRKTPAETVEELSSSRKKAYNID